MNYKNVLEELYSIDNSTWKFGLSNIKKLLKKLSNPENKIKCIHVAGTNGKGSTCAIISSILQEAGYKVGMYTSPHLSKFNERMRINNRLISDKDLVKYYLLLKRDITKQTFFDITTAVAFLYFYEKKVDFVVIETGLGGRLDSTNVITPLVSVITNVGMEHTSFLGNTIRKIASEKAGIIKKGVPVVTSATGDALSVIKKTANINKSKINEVNNHKLVKRYDKNNHTYSFSIGSYKNINLKKLRGEFQVENALLAINTIETLNEKYQYNIKNNHIKTGVEKAYWPGRFDFIGKNILVDAAHNLDGFKGLFKELKKFRYNKLILIIGLLKDKNVKKILNLVKDNVDTVIISKPNNDRSVSPDELKKNISGNSMIIENPKKALSYAKKIAKKNDLILVAGSIYMIGEIISLKVR